MHGARAGERGSRAEWHHAWRSSQRQKQGATQALGSPASPHALGQHRTRLALEGGADKTKHPWHTYRSELTRPSEGTQPQPATSQEGEGRTKRGLQPACVHEPSGT